MIDYKLEKCPEKIRNIYSKIIRICNDGSEQYRDGYVIGVLTTRGGANGILVYKNPKYKWYDGISFYNSETNGNFVCEEDEDLDSEMKKQIEIRKRWNEGNYEWYRFMA